MPKKRAPTVAQENKGRRSRTFPTRLYEMLEAETTDTICWCEHGLAFVVNDPDTFRDVLLVKYFKHSKLTSFQRQLNLYGFRRIQKGPDSGSYYHPNFKRDDFESVRQMKRVAGRGATKTVIPAHGLGILYVKSESRPGIRSSNRRRELKMTPTPLEDDEPKTRRTLSSSQAKVAHTTPPPLIPVRKKEQESSSLGKRPGVYSSSSSSSSESEFEFDDFARSEKESVRMPQQQQQAPRARVVAPPLPSDFTPSSPLSLSPVSHLFPDVSSEEEMEEEANAFLIPLTLPTPQTPSQMSTGGKVAFQQHNPFDEVADLEYVDHYMLHGFLTGEGTVSSRSNYTHALIQSEEECEQDLMQWYESMC